MLKELVLKDNNLCKFQRNRLDISDIITKEDWHKIGEWLHYVEGNVQFWIGDWACHGVKRGWYTERSFYDEIEDITGLNRCTIQDYKYVANSVKSSLRNEDLTYSHHKQVAHLKPEKQKKYLQLAVDKGLSVRALRKEIYKEHYDKIIEEPLPSNHKGKYRVIYADPPWSYGNAIDIAMPGTTVPTTYYPTMTIEEICDLQVGDLAADDSVLFLWVTSPLLEKAFEVINAWGFEYKTSFVWDKVKHNFGYYNSVRHEFLLIATRGSCLPDIKELHDSVVEIERTKHSEKPEYFRELIDKLYIHGKRIELFARNKSKGWDVWGNQIK